MRFRPFVLTIAIAAAALMFRQRALAQTAPPGPHDSKAFDLMNVLAEHGAHNLDAERWNLYGQLNYISHWKTRIAAPYSGPNSLQPEPEHSFTGSATLYLGVRLWTGAEGYLVPEMISERALSGLHGIGGAIQNFELQKQATVSPQIYRSRAFVRQTIKIGGDNIRRDSDPMQLASTTSSRRLVFTIGTSASSTFSTAMALSKTPGARF